MRNHQMACQISMFWRTAVPPNHPTIASPRLCETIKWLVKFQCFEVCVWHLGVTSGCDIWVWHLGVTYECDIWVWHPDYAKPSNGLSNFNVLKSVCDIWVWHLGVRSVRAYGDMSFRRQALRTIGWVYNRVIEARWNEHIKELDK